MKDSDYLIISGMCYVLALIKWHMNNTSLKSKIVLVFLLSKLYQYGQMSRRTFLLNCLTHKGFCPVLLYGAEIWGSERI